MSAPATSALAAVSASVSASVNVVKPSFPYYPYKSCLPTIFNWEHRVRLDAVDEVKQRRVRDIDTRDVYIAKTSDAGLRALFAGLSIGAGLICAIKMVARTINLIRGEFISRGCDRATKEYNVEWLKWVRGKRDTAPTNALLYGKTALYCTWYLIKEVVKIVTLPLAAIALTFAALDGVIQPLDGRKMWSSVERFWSRDILKQSSYFEMRMLDFFVVCVQPRRVWDEQDLNSVRPDLVLLKGTLRGLLAQIEGELRTNPEYYAELGVDISHIKTQLTKYRDEMLLGVSACDTTETNSDDTQVMHVAKSPQAEHAKVLTGLLNKLTKCKAEWDLEIVAAQQNLSPLQKPAENEKLNGRVAVINQFNTKEFDDAVAALPK